MNLKIYVISLREDQHRREEMRKQFGCFYEKFEIIEGIRLSDKYSLSNFHGQQKYDSTLTTAELGCALSHVTALEHFLRSESIHALILEDDVIGGSADLADIANAMHKLPDDAFLLCGGQEGLRGEPYNYGKPTAMTNVFQIPEVAKKFYTRACCYGVTKSSAAHIVAIQRKNMSLSDNWGIYFKGWDNFFFMKKISHPINLVDSNIEQERIINTPTNEIARIRRDGVSKVISRFLSKLILRIFHRQLGFVQVK